MNTELQVRGWSGLVCQGHSVHLSSALQDYVQTIIRIPVIVGIFYVALPTQLSKYYHEIFLLSHILASLFNAVPLLLLVDS